MTASLQNRFWQSLRRRRENILSPLLLKIFSINCLSLVIILAGLLYIGRYQDQQIGQAQNNLRQEARLTAGILAEELPGRNAAQILKTLRQLIALSADRARVFNQDGKLIADTNWSKPVYQDPAPFLSPALDVMDSLIDWFTKLMQLTISRSQLVRFDEASAGNADAYPDANLALQGLNPASVWINQKDELILMAAAPILKNEKVASAVLLTRNGSAIDYAVREQRADALWVIALGLIVNFIISLYLALSIGRPVRRLAKAARDIQTMQGQNVSLPDYSGRKDEIGDLSVDFRRMMNNLWQRMDALDQFAADVTHELKNPLTSLRSAIETMRIVKDEKQQRRLYNIIQNDVQRLDRLVTDIAAYSRLDAQLQRTATERIRLDDVLRPIVQSYNVMLGDDDKNRILIAYDNAKPQLEVWSMPSRLQQVMRNLIDNAVSFSSAPGTIAVTIGEQGDTAVIAVEDHGPGIAEDSRDKIFTRFYTDRRQNSKKVKLDGHSGLGLSIARQIVEATGGTIWNEARRDGQAGGRFVFTLPLAL